jgi:hypothetical protein
VNPAFKHLDAKLRIAELTIRQWVGVFAGVMIALLYADLLHPFGTMVTVVTAVYIAGIPIATVLVAGFSEFDAWLVLRSALRWRSADGRYLPGPGAFTDGYHVRTAVDELLWSDRETLTELDLAGLWGER